MIPIPNWGEWGYHHPSFRQEHLLIYAYCLKILRMIVFHNVLVQFRFVFISLNNVWSLSGQYHESQLFYYIFISYHA